MKKFFFAMTMVAVLIIGGTCAAQDVWMSTYGDVETYVMDDTITSGTSDNGRYFNVSVKQVKNGQLQGVRTFEYLKYEGDMWRMHVKDHSTPIHPVDKVFEFCMNRLGWSYRIDGNDPIVKFYR